MIQAQLGREQLRDHCLHERRPRGQRFPQLQAEQVLQMFLGLVPSSR